MTSPLNGSEARVALVMIRTSLFSFINRIVHTLTNSHFHMKSTEVCIKAKSTSASLSLKGQVTKHTDSKMGLWRCAGVGNLDPTTFLFTLGVKCLRVYSSGGNLAMNWHPIQRRVATLLIASCYKNRIKLRPCGLEVRQFIFT